MADDPPDQAYMDHQTGTIRYAKETPDGEWQIAQGDKAELKDMLGPITEFSLTGRKVPGFDPEAGHAQNVTTMASFYRKVEERQREANELASRMNRSKGRRA